MGASGVCPRIRAAMSTPARAALTLALYRGGSLARRETLCQDAVRVGRDAQGRLDFGLGVEGPPLAVIKVEPPLDASIHALGDGPIPSARLEAGGAIGLDGDRLVLEALLPAAALSAPGVRRDDLTGLGVLVVLASCGLHFALLLGLLVLAFLPDLLPRRPLPPLAVHLVQAQTPPAEEARKLEKIEPPPPEPEPPPPPPPPAGSAAAGHDEGALGSPTAAKQPKRYAIKGPKDGADPHLARQAALREAAEFGMIGLLSAHADDAPSGLLGSEIAGKDDRTARGNMWGDSIGDAFGAGGLGLSGVGEGGGGRGEGIGLGSIGTIGHGSGTGTGQGYGAGMGRLGGSRSGKAPQVRVGATAISGRLPPEVIQRIVRQHLGRIRLCYENGLRSKPDLAGRVVVRFVIGQDGAVSSAADGGSELPDAAVVSCVVRASQALSFPAPEGGIVTVTYPFTFAPGQ